MPLANVWRFPSKNLKYDQTLAAMKELATDIWETVEECTEFGHAIELGTDSSAVPHASWAGWRRTEARRADPGAGGARRREPLRCRDSRRQGKVLGLNCYHMYGPEFLPHDLGTTSARSSPEKRSMRTCSRNPSRGCRSIIWSERSTHSRPRM